MGDSTSEQTSRLQYMRPETRAKWRWIAAKTRRDIAEELDLAADREMHRLGIAAPQAASADGERQPAS